MKKHIPFFIFLFFLMGFHVMQGQGFISKRLAVGYNMASYLDLVEYRTLTAAHEVQLDFILNRRAVVGLYATASGMDYYSTANAFIVADRELTIQSRGLGVQFKWFRVNRGAIAPLGSYFSLKLASHFATHRFTDILLPRGEMKTMNPGMSLGLGRNSMIIGNLFFHFGAEAGLYPTLYRTEERLDFISYGGDDFSWSQHLFNFKFGLVYVL